MTNEIDFIKKELKKRGYPLENYVQSLLVGKDWHVQPNAYFLDKDTDKGREIDIKAYYDDFKFNSWSYFILNLLIQCRRLPGNAWIFFSVPKRSAVYVPICKWGQADFLRFPAPGIFKLEKTHYDQSEVLATNYCEVIIDKEKSNKRDDNIWECLVTLIKATSQELEDARVDSKEHLQDLGSFDEFVKDPFELISVFYPVIVFEGKMYEASFSEDKIKLHRREYVQVFVDYRSGRYKGKFCIDVVTKERFSQYLRNVMKDLMVFDKRRVEKSKEYEENAYPAVHRYYASLK